MARLIPIEIDVTLGAGMNRNHMTLPSATQTCGSLYTPRSRQPGLWSICHMPSNSFHLVNQIKKENVDVVVDKTVKTKTEEAKQNA